MRKYKGKSTKTGDVKAFLFIEIDKGIKAGMSWRGITDYINGKYHKRYSKSLLFRVYKEIWKNKNF